MEYVAKRTAIYVHKTDRGGNAEVVLTAGKIYTVDRYLPDGKTKNTAGLRVMRELLAADLIRLVDTKPIELAETR